MIEARSSRFSMSRLFMSRAMYLAFNLVAGTISVAIAVNFFNATPTFNPYELSLDLIGSVFLILGIAKLAATVFRRWDFLRYVLAVDIGAMLFWGFGSFISWRQNLSSWQLGAVYFGLCAFEVLLVIARSVTLLTTTEHPE